MRISIIGSTGSIGCSAARIAERLNAEVVAIAAGQNVAEAERQARLFRPRIAAMGDEHAAAELKRALADTDTKVLAGESGVLEAAASECDVCIDAVVGIAGLRPALAALSGARRLALANKESLVCAGETVLSEARRRGVEVIPVDSEHSAIFQCLDRRGGVKKLILTASGGPFFGYTREMLERVTVADALRHPNWSMGAKITVDSATLMNKGLEFIEAMQLFGVSADAIEVVIQRESIIHSMVEFVDGAVIAQLGIPDMEIPIQYALTYPERAPAVAAPDFSKIQSLSFSKPDTNTFKCLPLAISYASRPQADRAALNGANEAAVAEFIAGRIPLTAIAELVERAADRSHVSGSSLEDIFRADATAREEVKRLCGAGVWR